LSRAPRYGRRRPAVATRLTVGALLYGDAKADQGGDDMAKNTGKGSRRGAVKNRSEFKHPNGTHVKRDTQSGRILNVSKNPHKGVRDEK
jgi:hypothetical protein